MHRAMQIAEEVAAASPSAVRSAPTLLEVPDFTLLATASVCMSVHTCVCTMHARTHPRTHAPMHPCTHLCVRACVCVRACACVRARACARARARACVRACVRACHMCAARACQQVRWTKFSLGHHASYAADVKKARRNVE